MASKPGGVKSLNEPLAIKMNAISQITELKLAYTREHKKLKTEKKLNQTEFISKNIAMASEKPSYSLMLVGV